MSKCRKCCSDKHLVVIVMLVNNYIVMNAVTVMVQTCLIWPICT